MKQPIPEEAAAILAEFELPPRLERHLQIVAEVAAEVVDGLLAQVEGLQLDREAIVFGAATHDIGKILHAEELHKNGHQHERAGEQLLLERGVEPSRARFARTHGACHGPESTIEDRLVAVADEVWKGRRDELLEQAVAADLAAAAKIQLWDAVILLDDLLTRIGSRADERLARARI